MVVHRMGQASRERLQVLCKVFDAMLYLVVKNREGDAENVRSDQRRDGRSQSSTSGRGSPNRKARSGEHRVGRREMRNVFNRELPNLRRARRRGALGEPQA